MSEATSPADRGDRKHPIQIDEETFEYIERIVCEIAANWFPKRIERDDLIQSVLTKLVNKPPVWIPAKGASRETFIYRCVWCELHRLFQKMHKEGKKFQQGPKPKLAYDEDGNGRVEDPLNSGESPSVYIAAKPTEAEILEHIEGEENRRLCLAYIRHDGNATKTAKEVGLSDKTVLRRLARLGPKLLDAGYVPPPKLKEEHGLYIRARGPGKSRGS
jgi:DNA-directed RNA polymerase specialized sigma24 family protein